MAIKGPEKAKMGEEIDYKIIYLNSGKVDINNAKIILSEPSGFQLTSSAPEIDGHSFHLGDIKKGEKGYVELSGTLIDSPEQVQTLKATLIFTPSNFSAEFSIKSELSIVIEPLDLGLVFNTLPNAATNEVLQFDIEYKNNELFPIENIKLKFVAPETFSLESTTPEFTTPDEKEWSLGKLDPGDEGKIVIKGKFTGENLQDKEPQELKVQLLLINKEEQNYQQQELIQQIQIVEQAISTTLIINGSNEDQNINYTDNLQFTVNYKNNGKEEYNNLALSVIIESEPIELLDWEKLDDELYGRVEKTDKGKKITWTGNQIDNLETLGAGEKNSLNFSLPLRDLEIFTYNDLTKAKLVIYSQINISDTNRAYPNIESNKITLMLNSNTNLQTEARYYYTDGTPIGSGSIPPKSNQETEYVIFWELNNDLHEIENITISTTLPDKVEWLDKYTLNVGEMFYADNNREITWTLNRLPVSAENPTINFRIKLTPDTNDVGKLMKLLNNITLRATDTETGDIISETYGIVSTNLESDEFAVGKGIVTE